MQWISVNKKLPQHKDLCVIELQNGIVQPAIYYDNQSFEGFYPFTTFYSNSGVGYYDKVITDIRFVKIKLWALLPSPPKTETK